MHKNSGAFTSFLKHPATLITAGLGTAAGTGVISYKKGKKAGAENAANELTSAFTAANEIENKSIADDISKSFKDYNEKENQEIAKNYFNKGIQMSQMKKEALLRIYNESFENELEKMAAPMWMKAVGAGIKKAYGATMGQAKRFGGAAAREWGAMNPKQKALLGIAAGTAAGAGVGGGIMTHSLATRNDRISRYPKRMERIESDRARMGL